MVALRNTPGKIEKERLERMQRTISDYLLAAFTQLGIHRLYGTNGPGLQGVFNALARQTQNPTFIALRTEKEALRMAGAHARYTNQIGVCLISAEHKTTAALLEGLVAASAQQHSMVIVIGQAPEYPVNGDAPDLVDVLQMITRTAPTVVSTPEMLCGKLPQVLQTTQQHACIRSLIVPTNVQEQAMPLPAHLPPATPEPLEPVVEVCPACGTSSQPMLSLSSSA